MTRIGASISVLTLVFTTVVASAPSQTWQAAGYPKSGHLVCDVAGQRILSVSNTDTWALVHDRWQLLGRGTKNPVAYHASRRRVMNDTHELVGNQWMPLRAQSFPTPSRTGYALAYDSVRDRLVLFGGHRWEYRGGQWTRIGFRDTWEFDGRTWTKANTPIAPPHTDAGMAFDRRRNRAVLAGISETWEWDGNTWHRAPAPPLWMDSTSVAYDPQREVIVRFQGTTTWGYDGTGWRSLAVAKHPKSRAHGLIVYDAFGQRLFLTGGWTGSSTTDGWVLPTNGSQWQMLPALSSPGERTECALAYDSFHERVVLFGGSSTQDTWVFRDSIWTQLQTAHAPSGARDGHVMAFDRNRRRVVMYGGRTPDTWEFDGSDWLQTYRGSVTPPARKGCSMAYDSFRRRTVLFGGWSSTTTSDQTWQWDGSRWLRLRTNTSPSPRYQAAMAFDSSRGRMVLFGGIGTHNYSAPETWEFDGNDWRMVSTATKPPQLAGASMVYDTDRGRCLLYGGKQPFPSDQLWEYDGRDWRLVGTAARIRFNHSAVYDEAAQQMVVVGNHNPSSETWLFSPAKTATWTLYGNGCQGSSGIPVLAPIGGSVPRLGSTFQLRLSGLPSQSGLAYLALGLSSTRWQTNALPLGLRGFGFLGCRLWSSIEPAASMLTPHGGGSITLTYPIPNLPWLAGTRFTQQALVFDTGASNGVGSVSNGGIGILR